MLTGRIILRCCVCRYRCSQKHSINLVFCFSRSFPCVAHRVAWRDYGIILLASFFIIDGAVCLF